MSLKAGQTHHKIMTETDPAHIAPNRITESITSSHPIHESKYSFFSERKKRYAVYFFV